MQVVGEKSAFAFMILAVVKDALLEHPDARVRSLKDVESILKVRLVVGSPAHEGPSDPDGVGLLDWQVAVYSQGLGAALDFIKFIVEYKVRQGVLNAIPELLAHVADGNGTPLPAPWEQVTGSTTVPMPKPFSALPPKGRRHVLAQLERQEAREEDNQAPIYTMAFYGNLYPFKDGFEDAGIPGGYAATNAAGQRDYARYLEFTAEASSERKLRLVFEDILKGMPVYFIDMVGEDDAMAAWVRQQPSVVQGEVSLPTKA